MAARVYTDRDIDLAWLKGKTCAVIGFGVQGRAQALNLRDSGFKVAGRKRYRKLLRAADNHLIELVGRRLRRRML